MVFHWSLSNSKSPQVSRTLLSILADLSNAVVLMVLCFSPISRSFNFLSKPLGSVLMHHFQLLSPSLSCSTALSVFYMFVIFFILSFHWWPWVEKFYWSLFADLKLEQPTVAICQTGLPCSLSKEHLPIMTPQLLVRSPCWFRFEFVFSPA